MASQETIKILQNTLTEAQIARTLVRGVLYTLESYQSRGGSGVSLTSSEADFFDPERDTRDIKAKMKVLSTRYANNFSKEFASLSQERLFDLGCMGASDIFGSFDLLDQVNSVHQALSKRIVSISAELEKAMAPAADTEANRRANGALGLMANSRYMDLSTTEADSGKVFEVNQKLQSELKNQEIQTLVNAKNSSFSSSNSLKTNVAGVALWPIRSATVLLANMKQALRTAGYPGTALYCNPKRNSADALELQRQFEEARSAAATLREKTPVKVSSASIVYPTMGQAYMATDESCKNVLKGIEQLLAKQASFIGSAEGAANLAKFKSRYEASKETMKAATNSDAVQKAYGDLRVLMNTIRLSVEAQEYNQKRSNTAKPGASPGASQSTSISSVNEANAVRNPGAKRN